MLEIVHTEQVEEGKKARYPYKSEYEEPKWLNEYDEEDPSYQFVGWKYNGTVYKPSDYANEANNPFGPINAPTDILAMWGRIIVYCIPETTIVGWEGGPLKIHYCAVTTEGVVVTNEVELQFIPPRPNPISYTTVSNVVDPSGNYRVCTINISQNDSDNGKNLRIMATYKGVLSEAVNIYQENPYETVIPDSDYFIFNYEWEFNDNGTSTRDDDTGDGEDLDSLTIIRVFNDQNQEVEKSFTNLPVGYRFGVLNNSGQRSSVYKEVNRENICFLKWGGDNRVSGAEGAIVCLTNIAKYGDVSNLDTIVIDIYANWYSQRINGNMTINCMGYKSKETSSGKYNDEIIEVPHTNPKGNYITFEPNPSNCDVSWSGFNEKLNIKANGFINAQYEDAFIPYIDKVYSKVCSVVYNIGTNTKSYVSRTTDNGRDVPSNYIKFMTDDENKTTYRLTNEAQHFECGGIYGIYDNMDCYMFTNNNDAIGINVYLDGSIINTIKFSKQDIDNGRTCSQDFFNNLHFVKESNNKLKIEVDFTVNPDNNNRNLDIVFLKCIGDGIHPAIELPGSISRFNIYQKE